MSKRKPARTLKGAVCLESPREGGPPPDRRPSPNASEFETGAGACTPARTERRYNCHRHGLHRLAAAHGARVFCLQTR
jgi:hypothetical protein